MDPRSLRETMAEEAETAQRLDRIVALVNDVLTGTPAQQAELIRIANEVAEETPRSQISEDDIERAWVDHVRGELAMMIHDNDPDNCACQGCKTMREDMEDIRLLAAEQESR
jgi:hypothetical protein